ncbi:MAG: response regulator transcription factor [Clostridia bacterium]|nr:response regulator transcription factor [Clostridia bacterium]
MIFCVEDDNGIRNMMLYTLKASGFDVEGFSEGTALFEALQEKTPELIMLDIMLPGDDGITILSRLRAQTATADIPIIMATAKGTEYDKVIGLDMGADDYLAKPFGMMEMVSRVKAVLRRSKRKTSEPEKLLCTGSLELDPDQHTVTADGERIQLTFKEFEILRLFMQNPGRVYTREQLLSSVWGVDFMGETRTVDVHIGTLRDKLGRCGDYIETVRGVGYRMEKIL